MRISFIALKVSKIPNPAGFALSKANCLAVRNFKETECNRKCFHFFFIEGAGKVSASISERGERIWRGVGEEYGDTSKTILYFP